MNAVKTRPGRLSHEKTLALWREYKRNGDPRVKDRLILTFEPMVKYIVYRKVREIPARCDVEDFISCGLEALIRSIDRFDPEKGGTIEQFAWTRIHGADDDSAIERIDTLPSQDVELDPEQAALRDDAKVRFRAAFERLPDRDRKVAVLLYVHNLTLR